MLLSLFAGIDLVSEEVSAASDADGDGLLDYAEFKQLYQACRRDADAEAKRWWRALFVSGGGAGQSILLATVTGASMHSP